MKTNYFLSYLWTAAVLVCVVCWSVQTDLKAQDTPAAVTPAAETPAPAAEPTPAKSFLELEKEDQAASRPLMRGIVMDKVYKKRLPAYYRSLGLTKRQSSKIYSLQEDYHSAITILEMRVERLKKELLEKSEAVLTAEQKVELKKAQESKGLSLKEGEDE